MKTIQELMKALADARTLIEEVGAQVNAWGDSIADDRTIAPPTIAIGFFALKTEYDALDKAVKVLYHVKDRIDKSILPMRMEDFHMDMCRVPEIARSFSVQDRLSASLIDKPKGMQWLRDNGLGDLIQETVNAGTLASAMRNMILEEGREPPEDLIKTTKYNTISVTKYTPK